MKRRVLRTFPHVSHRAKGFILLEVMLATMIFGLVVVALAVCLRHAIDAAIEMQREAEIRLNLQNKLAEARQQRLKPGKETFDPDSTGIVYEIETRALNLRNEKKQVLHGLYGLTAQARWKTGKQEERREAEIYVYQP
ncbi:MAG: type II secretion system protein [Verrucomicrobia bacterium]|nr:type II secretion system protein [Verrucomicrobiota bacterium]